MRVRACAGEEDAAKGCDPVTSPSQSSNYIYISITKVGHKNGLKQVTAGSQPGDPGYADRLRAGVDLEEAVQWAAGRPRYLPWRNPTHADLALDHDWDARCKGADALYQPSRGIALRATGDLSAEALTIIAAINALPDRVGSIIKECARGKTRPDCMLGIEPRQVAKKISWRKATRRDRNRRRNRKPVLVQVWEPCSPEAICAARAAYTRWHDAMTRYCVYWRAS